MTQKNIIFPKDRFGKLIVIKQSIKKGPRGRRFYICICECGKSEVVRAAALKSGYKKQCNSCANKSYEKSAGEISWGAKYAQYRANAKSRNLEFNISKEEFKHFLSLPCSFCASPLRPYNVYNQAKFAHIRSSNRHKERGLIFISGIDRKDSSIGYIYSNCISCCKICNTAKNDLTVLEFYAWIKKIYNHSINLHQR